MKASAVQERHLHRPGSTQQILAGLNWIAKEKGAKSFFFIGSDYIWAAHLEQDSRQHVETC